MKVVSGGNHSPAAADGSGTAPRCSLPPTHLKSPHACPAPLLVKEVRLSLHHEGSKCLITLAFSGYISCICPFTIQVGKKVPKNVSVSLLGVGSVLPCCVGRYHLLMVIRVNCVDGVELLSFLLAT